MRVPTLARQLALGAFALWLGLWPTGDAITGASQTLIVLAPAAEEPAACCGQEPAAAPPCASATNACGKSREAETSRACGDAGATCDEAEAPCAGARPACADTKAARCGQCSCVSGLVLFATDQPGIDPDLALVGTLSPGNRIEPSRHPQPPVRPPAAALPIAA